MPLLGLLLYLLFLPTSSSFSQIRVFQDKTPEQLVRDIFLGNGVRVFNIRYSGADSAIGYYLRDPSAPNLIFAKGIILSTGNAKHAEGPNTNYNHTDSIPGASTINGMPQDPLLSAIVGDSTRDAAILEFDFIPTSDTIRFNYIFASEEYTEYVDWNFNDIFAFFISGPGIAGVRNIALLPGTQTPVTIKNVNHITNSQYYVDNEYNGPNNPAPFDLEYDGFTFDVRNNRALTAIAYIPEPCQVYHLRISIADVYDGEWDSAVLLEANSLTSATYVASATPGIMGRRDSAITYEACNGDITLTFERPYAIGAENIPLTLAGTARNGVDYTLSRTYIQFLPGVTRDQITVHALLDAENEGIESVHVIFRSRLMCEPETLTFYISDAPTRILVSPSPDTAFCFVSGGRRLTYTALVPPAFQNFNYEWRVPPNLILGVGSTFSFTANRDTTLQVVARDRVCNLPPLQKTIRVKVYYADRTLRLSLVDTILCSNRNFTLTPRIIQSENLPLQYQWQDGTTQREKNIFVVQDTFFRLQVQDMCSTAHAVARLRVARISIPNDTVVCQGATLTLWARLFPSNLSANFHWLDISNTVLGNTTPIFIRASTDNRYSIRFATPYECLNRSFGVRTLPALTVVFPQDTQVCAGQNFTRKVQARGGDNQTFIYEWYLLNNPITPIHTGPIFSYQLSQDQAFLVKVSSPICNTQEQWPFYVRVIPPNFTLSPIQALVRLPTCPNRWVPLRVTARGGSGNYSYRWDSNPAFNTDTYTPWITQTREVEVEATDNCMVQKQKKTLTAFSNIEVRAQNLNLCSGQVVTLQPIITGGCGVHTVSWFDERQNLIAISDILSLLPQTDRRVIVKVTDTCGSTASDTFRITVASPLRVINRLPRDTTLCVGQPLQYTVQVAGAGPIRYVWQDSASGQILSNEASLVFQPLRGKNVLYLTISDTCSTLTQTYYVHAAPRDLRWEAILGASDTILCINSLVKLKAYVSGGSGNYRFNWSTGSSRDSVQFVLTDTTTITLTVTDGCSRLDTTLRFYTLDVTYSIEASGGIYNNPQYPMVFKSCNEYIKIIFRRSADIGEQKFRIYFEPVSFPISPAIEGYDFTINRDTVHFRAGSLMDTLLLSALMNPDLAPLKTVRLIFEPSNCQRLKQEVYILPPDTSGIAIETNLNPNNICVRPGGTPLIIVASAFGGSNIARYEWRNRKGELIASGSRVNFSILSDTVFYVTAIDTSCALPAQRDSVKVRVLNPGPRFLSLTLKDTIVCPRSTIPILAVVNGETLPINIVWSNGTSGNRANYTILSDTTIWARATDRCFRVVDTAKIYLAKLKTTRDTTVCFGESLVLQAQFEPNLSLALPIQWYSADNQLLHVGSRFQSTAIQTTYYIIRVPELPCIEDTININVLPSIELSVAAPPAICQGNTITLNAQGRGGDGNFIWQWKELDTQNILSTASSLTLSPTRTTRLSVELKNLRCSVIQSDTLTIVVYPRTLSIDSLLPITSFPLCPSDTLRIRAYVSGGSGKYTYRWNVGQQIDERTIALVVAETTRVTVTVEDSCQRLQSSIDVWPYPEPRVQLKDTTVCSGRPITLLSQIVGGDGNHRFTWQNEENIILGTESQLNYIPSKEETIRVTITDGCNRTTWAQSKISLFPTFSHNLATLRDTTLCLGQSVTYVAHARGGGNIYFQWVDSASGNLLSKTPGISLTPTNNTTLLVTISDTCEVVTKAIKVRVIPPTLSWQEVSLTPPAQVVCPNSEVTITVVAKGGSGNYSYLWDNNSRGSTQKFRITHSPFWVKVQAQDGCNAIDSLLEFRTFSPLVLEPLLDTVVCAGTSLQYAAIVQGGGGNYSFVWQDSASSQ
ncbi:MAG: choice-of-anchor L domain-containing protein, partial [Bacteroidia bacterium]|nr:choice-of-anchor L domain-containing protein [Bacteroidia bacterium]